MDGDNIYSTLPAAANFESIRIGLSDLHDNVTVINIIKNYITIKKGSSTCVIIIIVTALAGAVGALLGSLHVYVNVDVQ